MALKGHTLLIFPFLKWYLIPDQLIDWEKWERNADRGYKKLSTSSAMNTCSVVSHVIYVRLYSSIIFMMPQLLIKQCSDFSLKIKHFVFFFKSNIIKVIFGVYHQLFSKMHSLFINSYSPVVFFYVFLDLRNRQLFSKQKINHQVKTPPLIHIKLRVGYWVWGKSAQRVYKKKII